MSSPRAVGRSHPGRARDENEDAFLADPDLRLFIVADGMGGHRAGEVASSIAVHTIADFVRASKRDSSITWPYGLEAALSFEANQLRTAIQLAHGRILAESLLHDDLSGMGTTVVAVILAEDRAVYANIGDSRLYVLRRGELRQLSTDHSWAASMVRAGADPSVVRTHPMRHLLTHALGSEQNLDVRVDDLVLEHGDVLVLCSDGLYGPVPDADIARILDGDGDDLEARADRLIEAANEAGGPDNVTVVLARYDRPAAQVARHRVT